MSETDGLDKLRTWAYGHMGDANTIAREVRTVLDLLPPADLPATLASVDDVRRVCEAAGLPPTNPVGCYGDGSALVVAPTEAVWPLPVYCCGFPMRVIVSVHRNAPAAALWHAIQAARSAS